MTTQVHEVMLQAPTHDLRVMHDAVYRALLRPGQERDFSFAPVAPGLVIARGGTVASTKGTAIRTPATGESVRFMLIAAPRHKQGRLAREAGSSVGALSPNLAPVMPKRRCAFQQGDEGDNLRIEWLKRRASENGFEVMQCLVAADKVEVRGTGSIERCEYHGVLRVIDEAVFSKALLKGIGPARTYGFGVIRLLDPQ